MDPEICCGFSLWIFVAGLNGLRMGFNTLFFLWVFQQLHSDLRGNVGFFKSFPSLGGRRSRTTNDLGYFVGLSVYHFFFEPC